MTNEKIAAELARLQAEFEEEERRRKRKIIPFPGVKSLITEQARRDRERVEDGFEWVQLLNDIALEPIREGELSRSDGPEDAA